MAIFAEAVLRKVSNILTHERYTFAFLLYHMEVIKISLVPVRMFSDIGLQEWATYAGATALSKHPMSPA
ncbi:hypothetical protein IFM46972_08502 [Aspergillus udagawae]|uniref:Uncharacterized protein n=1 Tax=Aspergillus udagawae TaxID=91492 RepID=A0A8H3S356_9EURO|nr:hypothetical protein IFM46972_08502 [Aspergillus udagawae]